MSHHHGHSCEGDNNHDDTPEMGIQYSLYEKIDISNVECLNESEEDAGKQVFKPWEERLNLEKRIPYKNPNCSRLEPVRLWHPQVGYVVRLKVVESDADAELLFNIPFTGNVKLKGIIVIGEDSDCHPARLRIFKNRPSMTFDDVGACPDQQFEMQRDTTGTLEYSTKIVAFSSVTHLTLHFPTNFGSETTKIYYIGLRGEFTAAHRHGVTICTYESTPNVSDHKTDAYNSVSKEIQ